MSIRRRNNPHLTPREREVALLKCAGFSVKAIAARFGLSGKTVTMHIWNIGQKLGYNDSALLRWGWLGREEPIVSDDPEALREQYLASLKEDYEKPKKPVVGDVAGHTAEAAANGRNWYRAYRLQRAASRTGA